MRSENMPKSLLFAYLITKILSTSWSQQFLDRKEIHTLRYYCAKIAKSLRTCMPIEELLPNVRK